MITEIKALVFNRKFLTGLSALATLINAMADQKKQEDFIRKIVADEYAKLAAEEITKVTAQ